MQKNFIRPANFDVNKAGSWAKNFFVFLYLLERAVADNIGTVRNVKVLRRTSVGGATLAGFVKIFIKGRELEKSCRELLRTGHS